MQKGNYELNERKEGGEKAVASGMPDGIFSNQ
jgi:hypothetical protein